VHLFGVHPGADARNELHAHRFAERLAAHAVEIVHAVEDDRQPAAERLVPELSILVHRGERDSLPHRPAAERRVADVRDDARACGSRV
jgi:hypothetical protein